MKIYLVIKEKGGLDSEMYLYYSFDNAMKRAEAIAEKNREDHWAREFGPVPSDWLYLAIHNNIGDTVRVVEKDMIDRLPQGWGQDGNS